MLHTAWIPSLRASAVQELTGGSLTLTLDSLGPQGLAAIPGAESFRKVAKFSEAAPSVVRRLGFKGLLRRVPRS